MKRYFLLFSFLALTCTFSAQAQNVFSPVVENGVFYLYSGASGPQVSKVEIFDKDGRLVKEADMTANAEKTIECGDLEDGQYYVMIHMNGEEYYSPLEITGHSKKEEE